MSQFIKFYFTSSLLNMFRTLIQPSSGACDFSIVSPHWLCVLVKCVLEFRFCWVGVVSVWQAEACHTDTTPWYFVSTVSVILHIAGKPSVSSCRLQKDVKKHRLLSFYRDFCTDEEGLLGCDNLQVCRFISFGGKCCLNLRVYIQYICDIYVNKSEFYSGRN